MVLQIAHYLLMPLDTSSVYRPSEAELAPARNRLWCQRRRYSIIVKTAPCVIINGIGKRHWLSAGD